MTVDTATSAYPQICGTKKDIEGYEKLCFTTYDGDTNTTSNTAYKCICGETL